MNELPVTALRVAQTPSIFRQSLQEVANFHGE